MLKKIMLIGILLSPISMLKAKNMISPANNPGISSPQLSSGDDLLNRIITDNSFRKYYISQVEFANKVIEKKAGPLFLKYIKQTISPDEQADLLKKLNLGSKKQIDEIAVNLRNEALAFFKNFPELRPMQEKERKELLIKGFKNLSNDNGVTPRLIFARNVTLEECFWAWMACIGFCSIYCSYAEEYSGCIWACTSVCATEYGTCWFIAD